MEQGQGKQEDKDAKIQVGLASGPLKYDESCQYSPLYDGQQKVEIGGSKRGVNHGIPQLGISNLQELFVLICPNAFLQSCEARLPVFTPIHLFHHMNQPAYLLILILLIASCRSTKPVNDPIPAHDSLRITSTFVQEERVINVWTPPGYEQSDEPFPVLYMPDGGIKEDFPHIANTLAELIAEGQIPPHMLVGIENTVRGRDLTGASQIEAHAEYGIPMDDGAQSFRAFITNELVPEINQRYRTNSQKGIIGESLAGLFVVETFLLTPEAFDFYIAMDPSLWWNEGYLVNQTDSLLHQLPDRAIKLWFAGSSVKDISTYTKRLAGILEQNPTPNLTWTYSDEPKEKHHTIFRATKQKAMVWAMGEE